jgi:hypothetical protein
MDKLTFKQYLESKDQLIKAMDNVPVAIQEYEVRKYCTLTVGEDEDEKQAISLKPKNKIIIEWQYANVDHPIPLSIKVEGISDIDGTESFSTFWSNEKLKKWLSNHTRELQSTQHSV